MMKRLVRLTTALRTWFALSTILVVAACTPRQPVYTPGGGTAPPDAPAPVPLPTPADTEQQPAPDVTGSATGDAMVNTEQVLAGLGPGDYELEAFVVELRPCPECPPPLHCKPCIGDQVIVHDLPNPPAGAERPVLLLHPGLVGQLQVGRRYLFDLHVGTGVASRPEVKSAAALP